MHACAIMVVAGISFVSAHASANPSKTVETVDGWKIKARENADGKFLACSMERFFLANKGEGRFRINIIAWPESVFVLLRGNGSFLAGEGVGKFDIVSNVGPLFTGSMRYAKSEVLFALNGRDSRRQVAASRGWSISMDGKRIARFPMDGAANAMAAVEKCANLTPQTTEVAAAPLDTDVTLTSTGTTANIASPSGQISGPSLAGNDELSILARRFSQNIGREDFRITGFEQGVLQWSYGDAITSGAALVTQRGEPAASYAASLAIRPDQCSDSVLTLPLSIQTAAGTEHAAVVSMCRGPLSVRVRHVHVMRRSGGVTYVLNYETEADPDGAGVPARSDVFANAFGAAVAAAIGAGG